MALIVTPRQHADGRFDAFIAVRRLWFTSRAHERACWKDWCTPSVKTSLHLYILQKAKLVVTVVRLVLHTRPSSRFPRLLFFVFAGAS